MDLSCKCMGIRLTNHLANDIRACCSEGGLLTARYQDLLDRGTLKPDPLQASSPPSLPSHT